MEPPNSSKLFECITICLATAVSQGPRSRGKKEAGDDDRDADAAGAAHFVKIHCTISANYIDLEL